MNPYFTNIWRVSGELHHMAWYNLNSPHLVIVILCFYFFLRNCNKCSLFKLYIYYINKYTLWGRIKKTFCKTLKLSLFFCLFIASLRETPGIIFFANIWDPVNTTCTLAFALCSLFKQCKLDRTERTRMKNRW